MQGRRATGQSYNAPALFRKQCFATNPPCTILFITHSISPFKENEIQNGNPQCIIEYTTAVYHNSLILNNILYTKYYANNVRYLPSLY